MPEQPKPWEQQYDTGAKPWEQKYDTEVQTSTDVPMSASERSKPGQSLGMPGSFEGHPENIGEYIPSSVGPMVSGVKDIAGGQFAKGGHELFQGASSAMMPVAALTAPAMLANPLTTAKAIGGGYLGMKGAQSLTGALGGNPEQQQLAGDVGGLVGGGIANEIRPSSIFSGRAPGLYQTALKPSTTLAPDVADRIINTGLSQKIPVGRGGLEQLYAKKDILNQQIADIIGANPEREISPTAVAQRTAPTEQTFGTQVNPQSDLASIRGSRQEFLNKHTVEQPYTKVEFRPVDEGPIGAVPAGQGSVKRIEPIKGPEAQAEKVGTYRQLRGKYGELGSADIESQKALARGLKEEIAGAYPEAAKPNLQESRLLELEPHLERAVMRSGNNQAVDIGAPLIAGGVKAMGGGNLAAAGAGAARGLLANPFLRSKLAIALYNAGQPDTASRVLSVGLGSVAPVANDDTRNRQRNGESR